MQLYDVKLKVKQTIDVEVKADNKGEATRIALKEFRKANGFIEFEVKKVRLSGRVEDRQMSFQF